jgi:hypothetical protein
MMRTRNISYNNSIPPGNWKEDQYTYPGNVYVRTTLASSPALTQPQLGSHTESMVDELVSRKRYGYCEHTKVKDVIVTDMPLTRVTISGGQLYIAYYTGGYWMWQRNRNLTSTWLTVTIPTGSIDWKHLSYEALSVMRPKFSNLSLINDILELREIANLINPLRGQSGASLESMAANMHLWYQYGIKPTLKAAKDVYALFRKLPESIRRLREQSGKVQKSHFGRSMDIISLPTTDTVVYSDAVYSVRRTFKWKRYPRYTATMRYSFDISLLSDAELYARAWVEALGANRPLGVLWNAVPLTFVVDWFADIGTWLSSLSEVPVIPIVVHDFCHSVRYEHWTRLQGIDGSMYNGIFADRETSFYLRRREMPSTTASIELGLPTIDALISGAALVQQRLSPKQRQPSFPRRIASLLGFV